MGMLIALREDMLNVTANAFILSAFLGDKESGKTTLIAKIQGNEDPKKGAGLEYCYVDVRDEYRDGEKDLKIQEGEERNLTEGGLTLMLLPSSDHFLPPKK